MFYSSQNEFRRGNALLDVETVFLGSKEDKGQEFTGRKKRIQQKLFLTEKKKVMLGLANVKGSHNSSTGC